MSSLLIEHGVLITMDAQRRIVEDGAVVVDGDRISYAGPASGLDRARAYDEVIDARRMAVMPGLIDCHAHAGHALVKTLGADVGDGWGRACEAIYTRGSSEAFWRADGALGALERIKFGVTCAVSLLGGGDSHYRSDDPVFAGEHLAAVEEIGIRAFLAVGPGLPPFPRRFRRYRGDSVQHTDVSFEHQLRTSQEVIERWHRGAGGRINVCVVSPALRPSRLEGAAPEHVSAVNAQAIAARELSRRTATLFTQDGHTRGSVRYAHEVLDILGPDVLLSHATDLDEDEISICASTDTRIVHNPSAIASVNGRCPVPELIDAGVTVAIGSDATAPDRSADLFRHMQQCMHYHRRHFRDPRVLPPGKTLEMVTVDAARALGLGHEIGSLEAGKKADLILLDLYKPHLCPAQMPLYRVVYYANGNDVDTVIVDGRVLMRRREVRSVDEALVLDAAEREAALAIERTGLHELTAMPASLWGGSRY